MISSSEAWATEFKKMAPSVHWKIKESQRTASKKNTYTDIAPYESENMGTTQSSDNYTLPSKLPPVTSDQGSADWRRIKVSKIWQLPLDQHSAWQLSDFGNCHESIIVYWLFLLPVPRTKVKYSNHVMVTAKGNDLSLFVDFLSSCYFLFQWLSIQFLFFNFSGLCD